MAWGKSSRGQPASAPPPPEYRQPLREPVSPPPEPHTGERRCFRNLLVYSFIQLFFAVIFLVPIIVIPFLPEEQEVKHPRRLRHTLWYLTGVQALITIGVPCLTLYVSGAFFRDPTLSRPHTASRVSNISFACFVMNLFFIVGATIGAAVLMIYGLKKEKEDRDTKRVMLFVIPVLWACAVAWNAFVAAACYKAYSYADTVSAAHGEFEAEAEAVGAPTGEGYHEVPSEPRR